VPVEEPPQRANPNRRATLGQQRLQLDKRDVVFASTAAKMKASCASILPARRSPPCGLAAGVPF
jgi:hypothetical protein